MNIVLKRMKPPAGMGKKKSEMVFHHLRRAILLAKLPAATPLLEQQIAEKLLCSQGTVREALMHLERQGLVERHGYRGTRVTNPTIEEAQIMARFRIELEGQGLLKSVRGFSADALAGLYRIAQEMDAATGANDYYRTSELDREFHLAIFRQAGFPSLEPVLTRCALHIHRFTYKDAEDVAPYPLFGEKHRELLRAIETGDPVFASGEVGKHIRSVIRTFAPDLDAFGP